MTPEILKYFYELKNIHKMESNSTTNTTIEGNNNEIKNNYIEADYRTVELCKDFMKDCQDVSKMHVYNPFTNRRVKKGTGTYSSLYYSVKKYLQSIDDEEFHSPIKDVSCICKHVSPNVNENFDIGMTAEQSSLLPICKDWTIKAKENLKKMEMSEVKKEKETRKDRLFCWRNDIIDLEFIFVNDQEFETKKQEWVAKNPELYSFFDFHKPQVLTNKFLMAHVFQYDENPEYLMYYLQNSAQVFLNKDYGYGHNRPRNEKRYACAMIMFWIYADFINQVRKFLKKNSKKLAAFLESKPSNLVKINKNHFSSLALANFLFYTKPDMLESVKTNYENYFNDCLKNFFEWCNRESVYSKVFYKSKFFDYMSSRIKAYRYISIQYDDIENFDEIIEYVSHPIPVSSNEGDEA
jgi:hypothetical protein